MANISSLHMSEVSDGAPEALTLDVTLTLILSLWINSSNIAIMHSLTVSQSVKGRFFSLLNSTTLAVRQPWPSLLL